MQISLAVKPVPFGFCSPTQLLILTVSFSCTLVFVICVAAPQNPHDDVLYAVDKGGDALLMACLWKAGYAITDPGFSFYHPELRMFDPVSQEGRQLLYAFTEGLSGGCDESCQV